MGTESSSPPSKKKPPKNVVAFFLGGGLGWVGWKNSPRHLGVLRRGSQEPGRQGGRVPPTTTPVGNGMGKMGGLIGKGKSHYCGVVGGNPFKK